MKCTYWLKMFVPILLLMMCSNIGAQTTAYINGIKYMLYNGEAIVMQQSPSSILSAIEIPESVTYNDISYKVTAFGDKAFYNCYKLASITIPSSVTILGKDCFIACCNLTSIVIPNSVTALGDNCFNGCSNLISVIIPNSVTTLGDYCFSGCSSLTSIIIPNSVTTLGTACFGGCSSLTSIAIPNSVTTLRSNCFYMCYKLASIDIPSSITKLGSACFFDCSSLTSITIPSSVVTFEFSCFSGCSSLTSINIPSSVTTVGTCCFSGCNYLYNVTCNWADPKSYSSDVFDSLALTKATLHIPAFTKSKYASLSPWSLFNSIVEDNTASYPTKSCETPTITYKDGKLNFKSATTGAIFHYNISCSDETSTYLYTIDEAELTAKYVVKAFATADGYTASPTTTATIYWLNNNTSDEILKAPTRGVIVTTNDGIITISGLTDGESVSFYNVSGILIGTKRAINGIISYNIGSSNQIIIAKIYAQSIKIAL